MTKKNWIISLALMAGVVVAPSYAAAATPTRSATQTRSVTPLRGMVGNQSGRHYAAWANSEIDAAVHRIQSTAARIRMSSQDRSLLFNNTQASANFMRQRVRNVSADGIVTAAERQQVRALATAIQSEMRKSHGNLDSFWFL